MVRVTLLVEGGQDLLELVDLVLLYVVSERLLPNQTQLSNERHAVSARGDVPESLPMHPGLP